MSDPLGIISNIQRASPAIGGGGGGPKAGPGEFRDELLRQIGEVNKLQEDATVAAEDVVTGRRNDVEGVMLATQKADSAFRLLLAVRNKVMDAYDEMKQMRV